jgi:purine-binding chemotaxis protein CheW
VPGAPAFADGLINVRGSVAPLADLRIPFALETGARDEDTRVIVIEELIGDTRETLGILADKVNDVCELDGAEVEKAPTIGTRWRPELIAGIGRREGRFVVVPDLDRIVGEFLA